MTTIRWLKPDNMADLGDEVVDDVGMTYLIMQLADFVNTSPFELLRGRGWLHIVKDNTELLLWDADRWEPVQTAGIPEVQWVDQRLINGCQMVAKKEGCLHQDPRLKSSLSPIKGNSKHPDIPEAPTGHCSAFGGK